MLCRHLRCQQRKERTSRGGQTETAYLERQEEALIEAAYDDGEQIVRRHDADPVAILQVLIKRKKAVAA
jgi:hypothetical protein